MANESKKSPSVNTYVKAIISIILTLALVGLLFFTPDVPNEIMVVFCSAYTCVIAFFFGVGGITATKNKEDKK